MTRQHIDAIARTVLYEGYNLYPYRPSSVKNQRRFNFGVLTPHAYSEAQCGTERWWTQTECLVRANELSTVDVTVRFLQLQTREVVVPSSEHGSADGGAVVAMHRVESLDVDGRRYTAWQEAVEREFVVSGRLVESLVDVHHHVGFAYDGVAESELLRDAEDRLVGALVREQQRVEGTVEIAAERAEAGLYFLRVKVRNTAPFENAAGRDRDDALLLSLVSAHTVLSIDHGEFVSLLDPPDELRDAAAACTNIGVWPVLVGENGRTDTMLASPIILYDYPVIAPESAGDLFDGCEIDEILSLRIMTLTDEEKRELRGVDDRTRQILERTESMPAEQLMKLHGVLRGLRLRERDAS